MKTIIITGASSGIGKALARSLDPTRYNIVLAARSKEVLEDLAAELQGPTMVCVTDVTDVEACKSLVKKTADRFGSVDILVNNAGLGFMDQLVDGTLEQWHTMVDVNVKGVLNCLHPCLPHLVQAKGHVINIGSIASHYVFPNSGVYCATKHAVFAISESIRVELMGKVKVTTISPGAVDTDFINKTTNETIHSNMKDYFANGMTSDTIAAQIVHVLDAPENTVVNEIILRPFR